MKSRVVLWLLLLLMAPLASCDSNEDSDSPFLLRVKNTSSSDYSSVLMRFPGAEGSFGAVKSGKTTGYEEFETAYRYGYVEVEANGETYRLVPIDYVGANPLVEGRYTYELDLEDSRVVLDVRRD